MRLSDLATGIPDWRLTRDADVSDVVYDSRDVSEGSLFVALRGGYTDGHGFVDEAVGSGAGAIMVEQAMPADLPQIVVPDTRAALATVSARFHRQPSTELRVIGITGTDGKTTTSYILDHLLRAAGRTTGMIGTVSVRIADEAVDHETRQTTPESADIQRLLRQMVESGVSDAVLEATSHGLDLHRLDHVQFAIGTVTNITHEHLEHHGTIANYRRAKAKLFERVSEHGGVAVINLDDEGAREMLPYCGGHARVITYSMSQTDADLLAAGIESGTAGSRLSVVSAGATYPVFVPLAGEFNVANALAALGTAVAAGLELDEACSALATTPQIPGRMGTVACGQPFDVIVDYAHTPESLAKVLRLLRRLNPSGRLIAVTGSAGERDIAKRPMQGRVSAELADISIFTNEDPRFEDAESIIHQIASGALEAGAEMGGSVFEIVERRDAIRAAIGLARPGDTILLAGKGHERSIIWNGVKHPWDEATVAREELARAGWEQ
jgi:UDP-N-acetylmuramoyl-L-alanyl-D-glutamate--2,6-diaminopimelate ligase